MTAAAVTVRGVCAGYEGRRGHVPVLGPLDFTLVPGERLAVVGESGCGKSTLLHVLAGLLAPPAGEVLVDGGVVASSHLGGGVPGCRAGHAAYMFQRDLLLPWKNVLANAVFAAQVAAAAPGASGDLAKRAHTILEEFGLGDALEALPRQLSGGMKQRVALARTLLLERGLVLLDEPFGSLDALTRPELQRWLLAVMEAHPATWILVTHDVREAVLLGDRVAVLAGRPARLQGWLKVPLTSGERRGLAGREAAGGLAGLPGGSEVSADTGRDVLPSDLDEAAETMRRLTTEVRGQLGRARSAR
jgi:ABC-type nitrate/sulfonate/bicarbonate transport system ATPase subunit